MAAAIMSFVFTKIASAPTDGVPPFLFAYVGMLGWTAFANTVTKASAVMIQNSNLVSKIFFPRLLLPFSTIFSVLVDTAVGAAVCILLLVIYHITPSVTILLAPLLFLMMLVLALGVGLFTSALAVSYRDVQYVIPVMVQILFFACPVAYSTSKVSGTHALFFDLNPMTPLIQAFRWSVIGTGTFKPTALVISLVFSVAIFLFGAVFFKKSEAKFADVI
jgi:lipopolysaccharide transport system permease protein